MNDAQKESPSESDRVPALPDPGHQDLLDSLDTALSEDEIKKITRHMDPALLALLGLC